MFAIEIDFHDGISPAETILVRRCNAIVGNSEVAHVVIEGSTSNVSDVRLVRGLGREFSCYPVRRPGQSAMPQFPEGTYAGEAELRLGELGLKITALDIDLALSREESPDQGALRVLRSALKRPSPEFPALVVLGPRSIVVSFPAEEGIIVGRSKDCGLRLDSADVSSEHARFGVSQGQAWVEDLGSTNGTKVGAERISGKKFLKSGERVRIGSDYLLGVVFSAQELKGLGEESGSEVSEEVGLQTYPVLLARGAEIRPPRAKLRQGEIVVVGRDPTCDVWVNAAHISRQHLRIRLEVDGRVSLLDNSSNGCFVNQQRLARDVWVSLDEISQEIDLKEGIILKICENSLEEGRFLGNEVREVAEVSSLEVGKLRNRDYAISGTQFNSTLEKGVFSEGAEGSSQQSALQRFMSEQRKQAHLDATGASKNSGIEAEQDLGGIFAEDLHSGVAQAEVEASFAGEFSPIDSREESAISEFSDFSVDEVEDELLRSPFFEGTSRVALIALVVVLVLFVLLLFIGIFSDLQFLS